MKIVIDIPETAYEAFKEWHKNKVATVEQSLIAQGIPYEEKPEGKWRNLPYKTPLRYKCSVCGSFSRIKSLYCPWCGVKMRGVDE